MRIKNRILRRTPKDLTSDYLRAKITGHKPYFTNQSPQKELDDMKKVYILLVAILLITSLFSSSVFAQNHTQLSSSKNIIDHFGKGWIRDIEFSPDGNQFAVATTTGIRIYDSHTGKEVNSFDGHMGGAYAISYSQDGQLLASAHQDLTIRLWEPTRETQKDPIPTLRGHKAEIYAITFSHDYNSTMLASASADKTIRLWNPHTSVDKEKLIAILPYKDSVRNVEFSSDNRMLAGGSDDGIIQVWDAGTADRIYEFKEHTDSVQSVHFSHNRTELVSASLDGTAILWSLVGEGGKLYSPIQHNTPVYAVKFSPDGTTFATGSKDKLIRLWDTNTAKRNLTLTGHKDSVRDFDFSPDGSTLVSGSPDGKIFVWDIVGARTRIEISGHTGGIKTLAYTEDNRIRACGTGLDGKLRLWDAGTSSELSILREHTGLTNAVTFSKNGKIIASGGSEDGTIFLSDVLKVLENNEGIGTNSLLNTLTGNTHGITALALSLADTTLASGGADGRIHLLDVATRRTLKILRGAQSTITALTFAVDGTHLFSGEENGTIRQWNALTGEEIETVYNTPLGAITALSYSLPNKYLAIGDATGTIQFFDLASGRKKDKEFFMPHSGITTLIFSEDGKTIVSGSENGTIVLWNMNEVLQNTEVQSDTVPQDRVIPRTTNLTENGTIQQTPQQIAKKALASTVYLRVYDTNGKYMRSGSGFFVGTDKITTNYHVIKGATSIYTKLVGKKKWHAVSRVVATDEKHDLALLKVANFNSPFLPLANSNKVQIGEEIYAVGNPQGWEGTVSDGIISGIRGEADNKWIQMTASISPGSSGGAVLNTKGKVIGIATLIYVSVDPELNVNRSQNINFAVPSNYLKALLHEVE